jgi:hypothetical protein
LFGSFFIRPSFQSLVLPRRNSTQKTQAGCCTAMASTYDSTGFDSKSVECCSRRVIAGTKARSAICIKGKPGEPKRTSCACSVKLRLIPWRLTSTLGIRLGNSWINTLTLIGNCRRSIPPDEFRKRSSDGTTEDLLLKSMTTFTPGPTPNTVRAADGKVLTVPNGWVLLAPGDAALTRRVKAAGDHWVVAEKKGRRIFSRGIWAAATTIERIRAELEAERSTESFAKKKVADTRRREQAQAEYVEDFLGAVVTFLAFHPNHAALANKLARAVTDHATPVGSGTVARTKRIPVEQRAEAAVIAWMRHQTTGYDGMVVPRVKGKRREVRRLLARRSQELLSRYRREDSGEDSCPLKAALA